MVRVNQVVIPSECHDLEFIKRTFKRASLVGQFAQSTKRVKRGEHWEEQEAARMATTFKKTIEDTIPRLVSSSSAVATVGKEDGEYVDQHGKRRGFRRRSRWVSDEAYERCWSAKDYAEEQLAMEQRESDDDVIDDTVIDSHGQAELWEQEVAAEEHIAEELFKRHLRRRQAVYNAAGENLRGFVD
jgi:hypothetical protein